MRMQDSLRDPNRRSGRQHGVLTSAGKNMQAQWGQRPLFSVPGEDQPPPDEGVIGSEMRRDNPVPIDISPGSQNREALEKEERGHIVVRYSSDNVSGTPTHDEIEAAFGPRPVGWVGVIIDGGGAGPVFLCVRSNLVAGEAWWYEALTKAV